MKIILSRKGFDSTYGGFPSPVFVGKLVSIPIPSNNNQESSITYDDLNPLGVNLGSLIKELGKEAKYKSQVAKYVHLDPDLYEESLPSNNRFGARLEGWRGLFGTDKAAAGILSNKDTGVNPGDIFLFFGWFNHIINKDGKSVYDNKNKGFHQIWGWLQIDQIIRLNNEAERSSVPEWTKYHPHYLNTEMKNNTLFIAREKLSMDGYDTKCIQGYGAIENYNELATLTEMDPEKNKFYYNQFQENRGKNQSPNEDIKISLWKLPLWFFHEDITKRLGYHNKDNQRTRASWFKDDKYAYLKSTSPGQEFILDLKYYPECAKQWILDIINSGSNSN